jgi:hypothetical protein
MEQRYEDIDSLATIIRSQREEIQKYRWIESEKVGYDIGFERAEQEWRRQHVRGWRTWLRKQGLVHPTVDVIWSQQEEIEAFKWIESEQRGYDIGWEHAVREWSEKYYEAWRRQIVRDNGTPIPQHESALSSQQRAYRPEHRPNLSASMKAWRMRRKAGQN